MAESNELPLLKSARREAYIAFAIWLLATSYSVGVCSAWGYNRDPATLTYVWGFPDWVFWGLVLPWGLFTILSSIFAMCFMRDEDLDGDAPPETVERSESLT